ncbi:MAG: transposase [Candidatus Margulisiibacteriota bacterium]
MNRGIARRHLFLSRKHKQLFLELLGIIVEKFQVEVHAFCLMGTHYHLLIYTKNNTISKAIQYLNSNFARAVNKDRKRDGFVFKGRFKSILINNEKYRLNVCRYIHLNPVEAGLVKNGYDFEWSSCQDYLTPIPRFSWLSRYLWQENPSDFQIYLNKGIPKKILEIYAQNKLPNQLG